MQVCQTSILPVSDKISSKFPVLESDSIFGTKYKKHAANKIKEEDKTKLRTQSLFRAKNSVTNLNAGTPHDWEDLKKYQEEEKNYD